MSPQVCHWIKSFVIGIPPDRHHHRGPSRVRTSKPASERLINPLGGLAHEVDHAGLDLWVISLVGLPMVEPMLVGVLELLWTKAGSDDCQRVCFDVRQGNRQSDVGHLRCPHQVDSSPFLLIHCPPPPARLSPMHAGGGRRAQWPRLQPPYRQPRPYPILSAS